MDEQTQKPIIMCIEQESTLLSLYSGILGGQYQVMTELNSEKALETIKQRKEQGLPDISVLVTGGKMPGLCGWDLIKAVKQIPGYESLPAVLCTAWISEEEGKKSGADYVLRKPFKSDELSDTIRTALE